MAPNKPAQKQQQTLSEFLIDNTAPTDKDYVALTIRVKKGDHARLEKLRRRLGFSQNYLFNKLLEKALAEEGI